MKKCYICNKDLENAETYYFDCEKYTCNNCYELYHKPKYNEIQRNELINHYQKLQNQKAIECLKEVKENFCSAKMIFFTDCGLSKKEKDLILDNQEEDKRILADLIDNKIKELEGKDDNNI